MTNTQQTAVAASALAIGAALLSRGLRAGRAMDFRGKSVLITGGSRGLGLLIARHLGAAGARLTLAARDAAELDRAAQDLGARGCSVTTRECDVADPDQVQRLVRS